MVRLNIGKLEGKPREKIMVRRIPKVESHMSAKTFIIEPGKICDRGCLFLRYGNTPFSEWARCSLTDDDLNETINEAINEYRKCDYCLKLTEFGGILNITLSKKKMNLAKRKD